MSHEFPCCVQALFWLDEALWADPKGDAEIFFHRGNILQRLNKDMEALTCYEKAIMFVFSSFFNQITGVPLTSSFSSLNPTFRDAIDARVDAVKKLAISPDDKLVDYCRGAAFYDLGLYSQALQNFQNATTKDPSFKDAHYNAAGIFLFFGCFFFFFVVVVVVVVVFFGFVFCFGTFEVVSYSRFVYLQLHNILRII